MLSNLKLQWFIFIQSQTNTLNLLADLKGVSTNNRKGEQTFRKGFSLKSKKRKK